jgi:hypothetical protein
MIAMSESMYGRTIVSPLCCTVNYIIELPEICLGTPGKTGYFPKGYLPKDI